MFTLLFIVVFNTKKGYIGVYYANWTYNFMKQTEAIFHKFISFRKYNFNNYILYRFLHTSITSRLTSYFLLSF